MDVLFLFCFLKPQVTNIISVSDMAEIAKLNKSTVMHDVFRIFSHTLTKRSLRMLYLQVFEALILSNLRSFHGIPKNIVIQLVADVCAHQVSGEYFRFGLLMVAPILDFCFIDSK